MAENYNLIFGSNASQSYTWSDVDYQKGWETVGDTPPLGEQFDALQRRADNKSKELNDRLTPIETNNTNIFRQPSTAYALKDIRFYPELPAGWYFECKVAGTTTAGDITMPSPILENDTVVDGTVTWTIRKIGSGGGEAVGVIKEFAGNGDIPSGYLLCDGAAYSRTMFPDLFAAIGTTYGSGDGSTTFNVPDYNTAQRFAQGSTVAGVEKAAGLPNITGDGRPAVMVNASGGTESILGSEMHGAFQVGAEATNRKYFTNTSSSLSKPTGFTFDASRSSSIYGNSDTVQPNALTCRYIIKAFDGQTADSALIDITQYANELAGKANRALDNLSADGENHFLENDFTIIYPNSGTEANPANVSPDTRYVETNPFPGFYVKCAAEILVNNQWGISPMQTLYTSSSYPAMGEGVSASQLDDASIVVQTGNKSLINNGNLTGNPFGSNSLYTTDPLPCRVKVWKIGKIPTA